MPSKCPYKEEAKGDNIGRRGDSGVAEAQVEGMCPQVKDQRQPEAERGSTSQEMLTATRSWKRQRMHSPVQPPDGPLPC